MEAAWTISQVLGMSQLDIQLQFTARKPSALPEGYRCFNSGVQWIIVQYGGRGMNVTE